MIGGNALSLHRLFVRIALSGAHIFAWIFVFQYFFVVQYSIPAALTQTILLYALSQIVTALATPLSALLLSNGIKRTVTYAILALSAAFVLLGATYSSYLGLYHIFGIIGFAILLGLYRALYWVPYTIAQRALETLPTSSVLDEVLLALLPAGVGYGLALGHMQVPWIFFVAAGLMILSLGFLARIPDMYERFAWGYRESFGHVITRGNRRLFIRACIDGMQGMALLLVWPLAVYFLLGKSLQLFGLVFSSTLLCVIIYRLVAPRFRRPSHMLESFPVRLAIVFSSWVVRSFVALPITIVAADVYAYTGNHHVFSDRATFEQTADGGYYLDEYTVLREIGLSLGKIALCIVMVISIALFPISYVFGGVFLLCGIAAVISMIIARTHRKSI
jgi:hypothetical protein